jgi:hypothetical protein
VVPPNLIRVSGLAAISEAALFVVVDLIDLLFSGASVRRGAWCYTRAHSTGSFYDVFTGEHV